MTALHDPFKHRAPEPELIVVLTDVVLLPFEGRVIPDSWLSSEPLGPMMLDFLDVDIETAYGAAKHGEGIIVSLPPGEGIETSATE